MKAKYLLPCSCGNRVEIESAQAGGSVRCTCGATLEVPALRSLAALERVEPKADAVPASEAKWTRWKGVAFLGAVIAVAALAASLYLLMNRPLLGEPRVNTEVIYRETAKLSPTQSWSLWLKLRSGIRPKEQDRLDEIIRQQTQGYEERLAQHQRWTLATFSLAGLGLLLAIGAVAVGWSEARRRRGKSR
ncbi:MAG: hypothetical protein ACYC35_18255 [Pirellulales bacterium]